LEDDWIFDLIELTRLKKWLLMTKAVVIFVTIENVYIDDMEIWYEKAVI